MNVNIFQPWVSSVCPIYIMKVKNWDSAIVRPRLSGPSVMVLSTFYPLFKTQMKCSSPLFNINQEPIHARKWALPGMGGTRMDTTQRSAERACMAEEAATSCSNPGGFFLLLLSSLEFWGFKKLSNFLLLLLHLNSILLFEQTLSTLCHYFNVKINFIVIFISYK